MEIQSGVDGLAIHCVAQDAIRSSVCWFISTQEGEVLVSIHMVNVMFLCMLFRWKT